MAGKLEMGEFKGMADVSKQPRGAFLIGAKPASAGPPWQFPCVFQESQPWPPASPAPISGSSKSSEPWEFHAALQDG